MATKRKAYIFDNECCICYESHSKHIVSTACNHIFCAKCIYTWAAFNKGCPYCRQEFCDGFTDKAIDYCLENKICKLKKLSILDLNDFIGTMVEGYIIGCDLFNPVLYCCDCSCCTSVFNDIESLVYELTIDNVSNVNLFLDKSDFNEIICDMANVCEIYLNINVLKYFYSTLNQYISHKKTIVKPEDEHLFSEKVVYSVVFET